MARKTKAARRQVRQENLRRKRRWKFLCRRERLARRPPAKHGDGLIIPAAAMTAAVDAAVQK